jgi:PAS domain S-box-containing protein
MTQSLSKKRLEFIAKTINGILWEADAETFAFTYVSPQSNDILGYSPEDWYENHSFWKEHIHPEDRDQTVAFCHRKTKVNEDHEFEYRMIDAEGDIVWLKDLVTVQQKKGGSKVLTGLMIDITVQRRKSIQKEEMLKRSYELADIGHWEVDLVNERLYWSPEVRKLHEVGQDYEPDLETAINFYQEGEHRDTIRDAVSNAIEKGEPFDVELKMVTAKSNNRWVRAVGETKIEDGITTKVYGSTQDITKRKSAEIQLKETEEKYRSILENSTILFYRHNTDHKLTYVSPQAKEFLGIDPDNGKLESWINYLTDHPLNKVGIQKTKAAIETGRAQPPYELQLQKKGGGRLWVKANEAPLVENGETVAIVGSLTDITRQKENERELEKLSRVARETQNIVIITDHKERIQWVNKAFERVTGYNLGEAKGKNPGDLLQGKKTDSHTVKRIAKRIAEEKPFTERIINYSKDGTPYWIQMDITPIKNSDGEVEEFFAIQDVITEQVQTQEKNRVLLQEVHHRVKNNLAIISGLLSMEMEEFKSDEAKLSFQRSINRIHSMAKVHELLYDTEDFSSVNIARYLKELSSIIQLTFDQSQVVNIDIDIEEIDMNINEAIPLGMLMNELLTNSLKYAFGDAGGNIRVRVKMDRDKYHVIYRDNGRGMFPKPDLANADSLGFTIIYTLLEQLEAYFELDVDNKFELIFSFGRKMKGAHSTL